MASGTVKSVRTVEAEWFRKGTESMPFCSLHSGGVAGGIGDGLAVNNLPALDTLPVRPKAPVLLGDDPYHAELPSYAVEAKQPGLIRRSTNVLDSLDLGDFDEEIRMRKPPKLEIQPD